MTASEFWGYVLLLILTSPVWGVILIGIVGVLGAAWVALCVAVGLTEDPDKKT